MAKALNELTIIGTIGKKSVRETKTGVPLVVCRVATDRGKTGKNTDWHTCVFWRKLADVAKDHVEVGQTIYLRGPIRYRSYEDENGLKRHISEMHVDDMNILSPKKLGSKDAPLTPPSDEELDVAIDTAFEEGDQG